MELAKKEVGEQFKRAATGSGFFVAALVCLGLSLLPFVLMWGYLISMWFGTLTWHWLGFLIVFGVLVLLGALFGLLGYLKIKKIQKPQRTLDSVNDLKLAVTAVGSSDATTEVGARGTGAGSHAVPTEDSDHRDAAGSHAKRKDSDD